MLKYRRAVRANNDVLTLKDGTWKFLSDTQGNMRATASELVSSGYSRVKWCSRINLTVFPLTKVALR